MTESDTTDDDGKHNSDTDRDDVVRKENRHGVTKDYVRTDVGESIVTTPKRIRNPVTDRTEDLTNLSADGYCRRFLALLSASNSPDVVDLGSSPVLTFDKDRWQLQEQDGQYVLVKREAETALDEAVLGGDECEVQTGTDRTQEDN